MKSILVLILFLFTFQIYSQNAKPLYNFSFEDYDADTKFPSLWFSTWNKPGYTLNIDSNIKSDGKYSIRVESDSGRTAGSFGSIAVSIPVDFTGSTVTLTAKMKLEDVKGGVAGILLRIDGEPGEVLQFDNMQQRDIAGTIDWKEYTTTLPLDEDARMLYAGMIFTGTGKVWVDDFRISIDGVDISSIEHMPLKNYNADIDTEFNTGSKIVINELNESKINNLYLLGKVWGFLKYYHPRIAEGLYNWDYELFKITPQILNASSDNDRNKILLDWVNSLGAIAQFSENKTDTAGKIVITPELNWLKDKNIFSDELITKFEEVKNAARTDTSYYIGLYPYVGNPKFKHEKKYEYITTDDGYRLLALFRFWNMIEYFFPDKHLINEDWNSVLKEFIPKFVNGKSDTEYRVNALKLIARIHDSHANVWGNTYIENFRGKYQPPLEISFIEEKPVVTGIYSIGAGSFGIKETAFRIGDEIISVNGIPVSEIIKEQLPFTPGSNYSAQLRDLSYRFLRTDDTLMSLQYIRNGQTESRNIRCVSKDAYANEMYSKYRDERNKRMWKMLDNNIGYIYPGTIKNDSLEFIMDKLKNTKGIVIDLRCYPAEFIVFTLGKYLMPLPTPFVKFTVGSVENPGQFTETVLLNVGDTNTNYYKGKIIILVNETTQSQAEYTTMAFRTAPNAKVIGSTTAGADGNVSEINLPGGIKTMISGIGVLTPDGKETQRVGIIPDIEVKQTIKGFKEGKDELLEKAIELIRN